MNEKFVYEDARKKEFNISIPPVCINRDTGRLKKENFKKLLMDNLHTSLDWESPKRTMPVSLDVKVYYPIPHKQPMWFHHAAKKSMIPCVTEFGIEFVTYYVAPALFVNGLIINYQQIHAVNYESTYSLRPRVLIRIEKMYQNIGLVREKTGKTKKVTKDVESVK